MSGLYKVRWAWIAEEDLTGIVSYIAEDSPTKARAIFEKIKEKASNLNQYPERGRIIPELQYQGILLYRELIVTPWRILYRISGKNVYILSVLDSHQNVEDILLKRLTK